MTINIRATHIELTDAIRDYAEEKMNSIQKYFDNIQHIDIDVGKRSEHHHKGVVYYAEVNVAVPKTMIRVVKESEDLYKAIDKVRDHLKVECDKRKGKMRDKDKQNIREQKQYQGEE